MSALGHAEGEFRGVSQHEGAPMSASDSFAVLVDDKPFCVEPGTTLAELVDKLGHAPCDVATAINGQFTSRSTRGQLALKPGDAVMLFQPIVGG